MGERMSDNLEQIKSDIKRARAYLIRVQEGRARLAGALSGAIGVNTVEVEFPEPDIAHDYLCIFGRRVGEPTVYRLSFGRQLKWVGISHPWGVRPSDIVVEEEDARTK